MSNGITTRRNFLTAIAALGLSGFIPALAYALKTMPRRRIPGETEALPIIGLGSSKPVSQISASGPGPISEVLKTLVAQGGSVVDTWPRNPANDAQFGEVINTPDLREALFVTSKIDQTGKQAGIDQFHETLRLYQRPYIDLLQVFSLYDVETPMVKSQGL